MNGHEFDLISLIPCIAVGEEGNMRQIMLQRTFLTAGRLIFINRLLQLGQLVQPFLASLCPQRLFIAALVEDRSQHFGNRTVLISG